MSSVQSGVPDGRGQGKRAHESAQAGKSNGPDAVSSGSPHERFCSDPCGHSYEQGDDCRGKHAGEFCDNCVSHSGISEKKPESIRDLMQAVYETRGMIGFFVGLGVGVGFMMLALQSVFSESAVLQMCREVLGR